MVAAIVGVVVVIVVVVVVVGIVTAVVVSSFRTMSPLQHSLKKVLLR